MPIRPTRAEIDVGALTRNHATLRTAAPVVDVLAVVKADAYGHGAVPVSRALEAAGVCFLGVALVEEGLALREAGLRSDILVEIGRRKPDVLGDTGSKITEAIEAELLRNFCNHRLGHPSAFSNLLKRRRLVETLTFKHGLHNLGLKGR